MGSLFSNPKILVVLLLAVAALVLSVAGGALGASVGLGFLGGPVPHIQVPAETVVSIAGYNLMNTTVMFWMAGIVLVLLAWLATRRMTEVPGRLQNVFESIFEYFDGLAHGAAGGPSGRQFLPLVLTIFLVVLFSNWIGILPGAGSVGRVENVEEYIHHRVEDRVHELEAEAEGAVDHNALEEQALLEVVQENADHLFVVFSGEGGLKTINLGRGEEAKVPLRNIVDVNETDVHALEEQLHESRVREAPEDYPELEGQTAGILVPYFRGASTDLNTTLAIAIVAMGAVQFWGIRALGIGTYAGKFFPFKQGPIMLAVGILELFGELARTISFTFRLFGNMFAGEILLFAMAFLLPLVGIIPFLGLELFVGLIQAFIFAMLTLVFGVMAVTHHGDEEHHAEEHH
ncbi:MAG: F0F1 ATP synthase subunit A [Dehalococcoidia bacterium]